jgi:uncharacterized protein involved in type VI secretion and phage assembly
MFSEAQRNGAMIEGVVIAIVTGIDPGKKQIKVNFPWRNPDKTNQNQTKDEMVARLAGTSKSPTLPQVNDQVLVAFEQGHFDKPIVIGVIWS